MKKNWLIRTKNHHILGPVSKAKVKELVVSETIKGDDEICSGNGYWMYVREKELVNKYVLGDSIQLFNPVQEATHSEIIAFNGNDSYEEDAPAILPEDDDLEYPSFEGMNNEHEVDDNTKMELNISQLNSQEDSTQDSIDLDEIKEEDSELTEDKKKKKLDEIKPNKRIIKKIKTKIELNEDDMKSKSKPRITVNFMLFLAVIFLLVAIVSFKYKSEILDTLNGEVSQSIFKLSPFSTAMAQVELRTAKKKNGFPSQPLGILLVNQTFQ